MHSYGYVYICQILGTSPNSFQTRIHVEIRTGKGRFCNIGEKKVNCQYTLTVHHTIQYWKEKRKKKTNFVHLENRAGQQNVQAQ